MREPGAMEIARTMKEEKSKLKGFLKLFFDDVQRRSRVLTLKERLLD